LKFLLLSILNEQWVGCFDQNGKNAWFCQPGVLSAGCPEAILPFRLQSLAKPGGVNSLVHTCRFTI
jgi:hypothetical protein